jgi:hypothetical protein
MESTVRWMFSLSAVRQRCVRRKADVLRHAESEAYLRRCGSVDGASDCLREPMFVADASLPNA